MAVHYSGIPCRIDEIHDIARESGVRVIEDAAHAFGSKSRGRPIGSFGDLVCFSFGPVKIITSIEGGALVTADPDDVQRVREMRLLGVDIDRTLRANNRAWEYDVTRQGWRYHMTSMEASVGLAQLALVDTFISNRQQYCRYYDERFADLPDVITPSTDYEDIAPYIYFIRVRDPEARDGLIEHMNSRGVLSGIHFQGAHTFSYYRAHPRTDLSTTELVARQQLTLPLHSFMDERTLDRVATSVISFFE
jgi:dTDP-4-amino-4,6-dideoxygalactose transaminase